MNESLLLRSADVNALAEQVAEIVLQRIEPELERSGRKLVDRTKMAELAGISIPALDRLVKAKTIPSVQIGSRRLFEPELVLDAMTQNS